jgi:hypothetical protein
LAAQRRSTAACSAEDLSLLGLRDPSTSQHAGPIEGAASGAPAHSRSSLPAIAKLSRGRIALVFAGVRRRITQNIHIRRR